MDTVAATSLQFLPGFALTLDIAARMVLGLGVLVAGFVVVVREQASRTSVAFFHLTLAIAMWIGGSALVFAATDEGTALAITRRFTHLGVAFIPSLLLLFVLERIGSFVRYRGAILACLGFSLLCYGAFSMSDWFIASVRRFGWGYVPQFTSLALAFVAFFAALFTVSGVLLVRVHVSALTRAHEKRTLLFVVGLSVSCLGAVDFLPAYGVPLYSFGCYAMIGLIASASTVAVRYRFMEITPANMGAEIMETMTEGLLVLDLQGNIRLANEAVSKILDTSVEKLIGRTAAAVPGLAGLTTHFPAVIQHGTETFDTVLPGEEGIAVRYSASAIYDRNREPSAIVCRVYDRTESLKSKAALRYEQNLLRTLIENLPVAVYVKDAQCRKVLANPVDMSWMMEFKPDGDAIGKTDFDVFPAEVAARFHADDQTVIRTGRPLVGREESYRDGNGTEKWVLTSKIPLFDESGAVVGIVGTGSDITERKRAEAALLASLREKDLLLQEVHHRVKNNLQVVCSMISLQRYREDASPATSQALRDMESRVRSMSLVHGILYRSSNVALIEFATYVQELSANLLTAYSVDPDRIRLALCVKGVSLPLAKAIPCGLIVNELIVNSIRHAFPGGRSGTITVEMSQGADGSVCLAVRDDGVGIVDSGVATPKRKTVGLSIVESLVQQLDGRLEIASADGMQVQAVFPA